MGWYTFIILFWLLYIDLLFLFGVVVALFRAGNELLMQRYMVMKTSYKYTMRVLDNSLGIYIANI